LPYVACRLVCSTGGMILTGRDTCHSDTSPTTNVTWIGLEANPNLCSVRLASNRLPFGTASCYVMLLLLGARLELRGSLGGRRRRWRYGCCGEGRSCSYLSGFLVVPYTARLAQQSDDRTSVFRRGGPSSVPGPAHGGCVVGGMALRQSGLSPDAAVSPVCSIVPALRTDSVVYYRRCVMLATDSVVK
jgi:hypothetical protein